MGIVEIKKLIEEKTKLLEDLRKKSSSLGREIGNLRNEFAQLEISEFLEYVQIDEVITLSGFYSFRGVSKNTDCGLSYFEGDEIKIIKKNKKSIVIQIVNKIQRKWDNVQNKSVAVGQINPGWIIRVDLDSFFHFYLRGNRKDAFYSYIKRKHLLDSLFDE